MLKYIGLIYPSLALKSKYIGVTQHYSLAEVKLLALMNRERAGQSQAKRRSCLLSSEEPITGISGAQGLKHSSWCLVAWRATFNRVLAL